MLHKIKDVVSKEGIRDYHVSYLPISQSYGGMLVQPFSLLHYIIGLSPVILDITCGILCHLIYLPRTTGIKSFMILEWSTPNSLTRGFVL